MEFAKNRKAVEACFQFGSLCESAWVGLALQAEAATAANLNPAQ